MSDAGRTTQDRAADILMNEEMTRIWIPKHRATTARGATRHAVRQLRDIMDEYDVQDYLRDGPPKVTLIHARDMADRKDEDDIWERFDSLYPWWPCSASDTGACEFWQVSFE